MRTADRIGRGGVCVFFSSSCYSYFPCQWPPVELKCREGILIYHMKVLASFKLMLFFSQDTKFCHYPCQCPPVELNCREGVPRIKDGCGCCYMCARQRGKIQQLQVRILNLIEKLKKKMKIIHYINPKGKFRLSPQ